MSKIEWSDLQINPIVGCSKISDGCKNCYAEKFAWRHAHNPKLSKEVREAYQSVVENGKWNGKVAFIPSAFDAIRKLKQPKRIFVGSMCDVFYNRNYSEKWNAGFRYPPMEWIERITSDISFYGKHTFIFLTKRADEMRGYFAMAHKLPDNLWLGATVESQKYIDRIDDLIRIPAKVRFISVEPMLSEITIPPEKLRQLQWVICGGETGPGARPMRNEWVRNLKRQCDAVGVPFFFKKWGSDILNRTMIVNSPQNGAYVKSIDNDGEIDGVLCREFPNG